MCNKSNQEQLEHDLSNAPSQQSNAQGLNSCLGSQEGFTQTTSKQAVSLDELHFEQNSTQDLSQVLADSATLSLKDKNNGYPTSGQPLVPQDGVLNKPTSQFESLVFASDSKEISTNATFTNKDDKAIVPRFNQINANENYFDDCALASFQQKYAEIATYNFNQDTKATQDSHADKFNTKLNDYLLESLYNADQASTNRSSRSISASKKELIRVIDQQNAQHQASLVKKDAFKPAPFASYLKRVQEISFTNLMPVQSFEHMTHLYVSDFDLPYQTQAQEASLVIPRVRSPLAYIQVNTDETAYSVDLQGYLDRNIQANRQNFIDTLDGQDLSSAYCAEKVDKLSASFAEDKHNDKIKHTSVVKADLINSALKDPGPNLSFLAKNKSNQSSKPMIFDLPRFWFTDEINETLNYIIQHHEKYNLNQQPQLLSCVGNWSYDLADGGFFIDETCAYLLGLEHTHQAITFDSLALIFEHQDLEKIHYNFTKFEAGTIFSDRLKLINGPFAGITIVAQGSAICRDPLTGVIQIASGFLCYEFNPQSDFLFRELMGDGTFVWNAENDRTQSSPSYLAMLGYTHEEFPDTFTKFCQELVHPDDYESLVIQKRIVQMPNYGDSFETCIRLKNHDGHYLWTIGRGLVLERNEKGIATKLIGSQSNIDLIHEIFDNIGSLMFTDSLTELYNRSYFMQNAVRYEQRKNQPMTVIFIDVTGLKLTNDILGHNFGDFLILKCVVCLKRALLKVLMRFDLFPEYREELKVNIEHLTNKAFGLVFQSSEETKQKAHIVYEQANNLQTLFTSINIPNAASFADMHQDVEPTLKLPEETIENLLKQKVRPETVRLAGDELLLLFPQCPFELAQQLKVEVCNTMLRMNSVDRLNFSLEQLPVPLCFGIGFATVGETGANDSFKQALERADMRMLDNKEKYQEQNHNVLKTFFEQRLKRKVSMRDSRRENILSESERQELRAKILEQKNHPQPNSKIDSNIVAHNISRTYDILLDKN